MMRRRLDLLTMCDVLVAAILLIIFMQLNVQAVRQKRYQLESTEGTFNSPNYPGRYPSGIFYEWIMPMTSKKLQIEFIELDLYKCYVKQKYRQYCDDYDYVYISIGHKSYCNWNRPTKPIIFLPWTQASIIFYSSYSSAECKGRGFKAKYRPVWNETTTSWPPTTLSTTTTRFEPTDATNSGYRSETYVGTSFLLILVALPLILVVACLYWACRRSSRPTVNQDILQTSINNWNYQTESSVVPNSRGNPVRNTPQDGTFLTVDLPPTPRTGYSRGISQTRQPTSAASYSVQRQTNDNELPDVAADDPPPSYDEVWENNDLNQMRSQSLESPPSYEAVMRESNENLESVNQDPVDPVHNAQRYHNDVRPMNLGSSSSNEADSGLRTLEITI